MNLTPAEIRAKRARRRVTGRESQKRFRERQLEKAEAKEIRSAEVARFGPDRVAARDTADSIARLAICLNLFFRETFEPKALAKIEPNVEQIIEAIGFWLLDYKPDPQLDDFWNWCVRLGEFEANPIPRFKRLFEARGLQPAPAEPIPAATEPASAPETPAVVPEPPPASVADRPQPPSPSVEEFDNARLREILLSLPNNEGPMRLNYKLPEGFEHD